ncbi:MAG: hypothetical protein J0H83_17910 [Candidatus Melainabacteria bacterium]|jgi:hypothetical protein|nr:hypothetical protein [Candidatus Melainabacteria bacterium]
MQIKKFNSPDEYIKASKFSPMREIYFEGKPFVEITTDDGSFVVVGTDKESVKYGLNLGLIREQYKVPAKLL